MTRILVACLLLLAGALSVPGQAADGFVNFETGQVRPLALSPDGSRLFAVNTPDDRLEIFDVGAGGLTHTGSVSVGLEPVAVAARTNGEVWVVNHLSDSVSIVDVTSDPPRVTRTLLTCDEPRDLVFAGPGDGRAFVTTARRGQNCPIDEEHETPGIGRAIVQVYDVAALAADTTLAGTPIANVVLFGDVPRALARSTDGNTVYAAVLESGNQTTSLSEGTVCNGGATASPCGALLDRPGGLPAPNVNVENVPGPEVGLIVKFNEANGKWEDELARDWTAALRFSLPDLDVFAIDAAAVTPAESGNFAHVGTVLFNMATNPVSGKVYVSNTEARNEVRFEGPGLAFNSTSVQGHLHEARITVLDGANVLPRHLNKHIDYALRPAPAGVKENSLATPLGMAVTADGSTLYVAAFGSSKIGVFDTAQLEADGFTPDAASHIALSGGGPTGMVLDEGHGRLYAFTRFDNAVSVVNLTTAAEIAHLPVHTPEPAAVRQGRSLLYDAVATSSNGEASCSSCHVFGDLDSLAWDLGNPDDVVLNNPLPFRIGAVDIPKDFHPLKGPMTTQSLRGMANNGSMHWRGDRTGGNDPGGDAFDEDAAFKKFNPAFPGLVGRDAPLSAADMQKFTDFVLTIAYPPNPIRRLDNALTNRQQQGSDIYFGPVTDIAFDCNGCHTLNQSAGFFGTDGFGTFEGETQMFKVPHLRNVYQKVGMFGRSAAGAFQGPQVRGFGVLHDGSIDTVFNFLGSSVFSLTNQQQRRLEDFVMAFDTDLAPIVGQQVTLTSANGAVGQVQNRLALLIAQGIAGACDVVVKGTVAGEPRGALLLPDGSFQLDRTTDALLTDAVLRAFAGTPGQELTYTCVPPGSGTRSALDRDGDGFYDGDERDAGTDPDERGSYPGAPTGIRAGTFKLVDDVTPPFAPKRSKLTFKSTTTASGVSVPPWDGAGDPSLGGAILTVHRGDQTSSAVFNLPAALWRRQGSSLSQSYTYRDTAHLAGPITAVKLKAGALTIRGSGAGMYQLDSAPQGAMALQLKLGTAGGFCAASPPRAPASANDTTARFVGARNTPAPAVCPVQ